jgi:hypothetical protein
VAPRAVIDRDWGTLSEILGKFSEKPEEKVGESWRAGGGIYVDLIRLVAPVVKEKGKKGIGSEGHISAALIHRLQVALTEMGARFKKKGGELIAGGREELEERVACKEMGRLVAEAMVADNGVQVSPSPREVGWTKGEYADTIPNRKRPSSTYRLQRMQD